MSDYERTWLDRLPKWINRWLFNIYPPYLGSGIKVKKISPDVRYIEVAMKLTWYNKNYVGTQFGGSMYSMTDPFYMFILMKNLGREYIVWDKAAKIEFIKPGKGRVHAIFTMTEDEIKAIKLQADTNAKYVFDKPVDILDDDNVVIARVTKTLYVRKRSIDVIRANDYKPS